MRRGRRKARGLVLALLAGAAVLPATSAHAAWRQAESAHFIVYGELSEGRLRAFTRRLEEFDGLLREFHNQPSGEGAVRKLPIYVVQNNSQLRRIRPEIGDTVGGFYSATPADVFAVAVTGLDIDDDVLLHEYVHHFVYRHYDRVFPAWLMEGYAEYFMTAEFEAQRTLVGRPSAWRATALLYDGTVALDRLIAGAPAKIDDAGLFYATSWALTHYMMADVGRRRQLLAYLARLSKGEESLKAWKAATGESAGETEIKLRRYVRDGLVAFGLKRDAAAADAVPVTVTALPASADDLLLYDQGVKTAIAEKHRSRYLATIRRLAARHPGDRLARLALGRVEIRYGDAAQGEAILRKLLEEHPDDEEALQALAFAKLEAAAKDGADKRGLNAEAATLLGRAFKIDANDYRTLYGFALSRSAEPNYPSDNVLNVLDEAVALAPEVGTIRLTAAEAMIERRLWDEADWMLQPIARSPHGGELTEQAQALIKQVRDSREAATSAAR